jgi:hypothetical protein
MAKDLEIFCEKEYEKGYCWFGKCFEENFKRTKFGW